MIEHIANKKILAALICVVSLISTGHAADSKPVDVPAGELGQALRILAKQAGVELFYQTEVVKGLRTKGVSGTLPVQAAVAKLLEGTPLVLQTDSSGAMLIALPASTSASSAPLNIASNDENSGMRKVETEPPVTPEQAPQEVVVTATRRAQRIQDVPLSITALSADDIDRRGLVGGGDYLRGIPGVNQVDSANGPSIAIRGIESSPQNQNFASGATTATYFGETPTTNSAGLSSGTNVDLKLVDIERVEVLRGPQGTAFGNSSMGGAVRTIPAAPRLDRFEGKLAAGFSSTGELGGENYNGQLVANLPLIKDKFAIRAVGYRFEDSGFYRNIAGSDTAFRAAAVTPFGAAAFAVDENEVGEYQVTGGRLSALFQATDDLRLTLSYITQDIETDGLALATRGTYDQAVMQVDPQHVVRGQGSGVADAEIEIANAVLEYDFAWANLVATYSRTDSGSTVSQSDQLYVGSWPASSLAIGGHREDVGEVRLVTRLQGPLNFIAGLYTEKLTDDYWFNYRWFGDPATNFLCVACVNQQFLGLQLQRWDLKQKAAFGEVSWEFLERFTFTGGIRAYDYDRTIAIAQSGPILVGTNPPSNSFAPTEASGNNWRANLSYKPVDNALLYAGWSQGFRLGKPQPQLPATTCDPNGDGIVDGTTIPLSSTGNVNSDAVDSYELGAKFATDNRRFTVDGAVFRMEWNDIPVRAAAGVRPTSCGLAYVTNAGEALSEGVELQSSFQVAEPLRVDLGASWVHARLTRDVPGQGFFAGDRLPGSPKVNANLGLQFDFELAGYNASLRADSIYVGSFFGDVLETPNLRAGDYVKLDASARITIRSLDLDLFVRNLTNEDAFTFRGVSRFAGAFHGYRMQPRTVGLQLRYGF